MSAVEHQMTRIENAVARLERVLLDRETESARAAASEDGAERSAPEGEIDRLRAELAAAKEKARALSEENARLRAEAKAARSAAEDAAKTLDDAIDDVDALLGE